MDFFSAGLGLAGLSFVLGLAWRVRRRRRLPLPAPSVSRPEPGLIQALTSGLADIALLRRTLRGGKLRWAGHTLLLLGTALCSSCTAMDGIVTRPIFPATSRLWNPGSPCATPGLVALAGLGLLIRHRAARLKTFSRAQDWTLLGLLAALLASGFFLEAAKIALAHGFRTHDDRLFPRRQAGESWP